MVKTPDFLILGDQGSAGHGLKIADHFGARCMRIVDVILGDVELAGLHGVPGDALAGRGEQPVVWLNLPLATTHIRSSLFGSFKDMDEPSPCSSWSTWSRMVVIRLRRSGAVRRAALTEGNGLQLELALDALGHVAGDAFHCHHLPGFIADHHVVALGPDDACHPCTPSAARKAGFPRRQACRPSAGGRSSGSTIS